MNFNLNEFLSSVANTLDAVEIDIFGMPTNHSKRISYISARIAHELNLSDKDIYDLAALSIMHDNGATIKILEEKKNLSIREIQNITESRKEHCIIGEENISHFPFHSSQKNVIKYHHEKYDGSGFFGITGTDIPLFSQIIALADTLDLNFILNRGKIEDARKLIDDKRDVFFASYLADIFLSISEHDEFWDALSDEKIDESLRNVIPAFENELSYREIRSLTKTFSKIIDAKSVFTQTHSSGLSKRVAKMANFYKMDPILKHKLAIASDLHDLGKLSIRNSILDKPGKLTVEEFDIIKKHPVTTRHCLQGIKGFEEITLWASNHHEKLDGSGYPNGLTAKEIDFPTRLIVCLDIYQALREKRPYRNAVSHDQAMSILNSMVKSGKIDGDIVRDIGIVYAKKEKH